MAGNLATIINTIVTNIKLDFAAIVNTFKTDITDAILTKVDTSALSTVATTGSYNDLIDTPIISDGAVGPQGPAGANGPIGLQGVTGQAGPIGPQGPVGPAGANGVGYDINTTEYITGNYRNDKIIYGIEVNCGPLPNNMTLSVQIPNYNSAYIYWIDTTNCYTRQPGVNTLNPTEYYDGSIRVSTILNFPYIKIITNKNMSAYTITKIVLNYTKNV